jgi:hypothetical protein
VVPGTWLGTLAGPENAAYENVTDAEANAAPVGVATLTRNVVAVNWSVSIWDAISAPLLGEFTVARTATGTTPSEWVTVQ